MNICFRKNICSRTIIIFFLPIYFFYSHLFSPCFALDYLEEMKAQIVKVSPDGYRIILNRGREDGLVIQDTANFQQDQRFLVRGVAIIVNLEYSEWFIQRGDRLNLKESMDVNIISLYGVQKPVVKNLAEIQATSFMKKLKTQYYEKNRRDIEEQKREQEKILKKKYALERYQRLKIPNQKITLDLAPLSFSSPRQERALEFGVETSNSDQSSLIFFQKLRHFDSQFHNRFSQKKLKRNEQSWFIEGEMVDFYSPQWNSFHLLHFLRKTEDHVSPIHHQLQLGFMGFKKYWKLHYRIPHLSFSYTPILEFYSGDQRSPSYSTNPSSQESISRQQQTLLRHGLTGKISLHWDDQWTLEESLSLLPRFYFNTWPMAIDEMPWNHSLRFHLPISKQASISYENQYQYDARLKSLQVAGGEWKNSFYLHYQFELQDLFL